jgi:hypothetical protein
VVNFIECGTTTSSCVPRFLKRDLVTFANTFRQRKECAVDTIRFVKSGHVMTHVHRISKGHED